MAGFTYRWRDGVRISVNAQIAGEEIERLRKKAGGLLAPHAIVSASRDETAVLHSVFEWDNGKAAERYREDRARHIVQNIVVTIKPRGEERTARAFVSVEREGAVGYTSLSHALSDADLRAQMVASALRELEGWQQRYRSYAELADIAAAIENTKTRFNHPKRGISDQSQDIAA